MWTMIFVTLIVLVCYLLKQLQDFKKKLSEEIQERERAEAFLTQERIHVNHLHGQINNLDDNYIASLDTNDRLRQLVQAARRGEKRARRGEKRARESLRGLQDMFNEVCESLESVQRDLEQMTAERNRHWEASQTLSSELFRADSDVNFWRERAHTGGNLLEESLNFLSDCALVLGDSSDTARNAASPNSPDLGEIEFVPVPFNDFEKFVNFVNAKEIETGTFTGSLVL